MPIAFDIVFPHIPCYSKYIFGLILESIYLYNNSVKFGYYG